MGLPSLRSLAASLAVALVATSFGAFAPVASATTAPSVDPRIAKVARVLAESSTPAGMRTFAALGDSIADAKPLTKNDAFSGTLDVAGRRLDVYSVQLEAGDRFGLRLIGATGLNADALLYAPGTTTLVGTPSLAGTIGDAFGKSLVYHVTVAGTYYIAVTPVGGKGAYTLTPYWYAWESETDNDITGVPLPASPKTGDLDVDSDPDDVYAVSLAGGKRFTVTVKATGSLDADLYLYGPGADATILTAVPVAGSAGVGVAGTETFVFDIPGTAAAKDYYLDVRARNGSGTYTIDWTIGALLAGAWDTAANALPLTMGGNNVSSLDILTNANDFYSVGIPTGQRLSLDLAGPSGADFDVYVYDVAGNIKKYSNDSISRESLVFDCTATGTYYVEVRAFSGTGAYTLTAKLGATPAFASAVRLFGPDRYTTALDASRRTFADKSCTTVVLATGEDFPDALSASALAGAHGSPMLLTKKNVLPDGLITELRRLGASKVEIVGGIAVVSPAVQKALESAGFSVTRTAGGNRYVTSAMVARRVAALTGNPEGLTAFLVNGSDFADANAVSPYAYSQKFPVLLTAAGSLPGTTAEVAQDIGVKHVIIAGGTSVVSPTVESQVHSVPSVTTVHREGGSNRFETTERIARYAVKMFWADNEWVGIATGMQFADALGGGAAIGAQGGVLLMTQPTQLAAPTKAYLEGAAGHVVNVRVFGGVNAVSDGVRIAIDTASKR